MDNVNMTIVVHSTVPTSSCDTLSDWEIFFRAILITGFLLIFVIGSVGNCLVIFLSFRPVSNSTVNTLNRYILNLAVADLLYVFGSVFFTITNYSRSGWLFGDIGCRLIICNDMVTMNVSVYILCVMSIERYVAVVHPMRSLRYRSPCCARRLMTVIWIASVVLVLPMLLGVEQTEETLPTGRKVLTCTWTLGDFYNTYMMAVFFVSFSAPSIFMAVVYALLLFHFYRTVSPTRPSSKELKKSKQKVAKIIFILVLSYWICYSPFWAYQLLLLQQNVNFDLNNVFGLLVLVFSYINSCLNPFFYTLLPKSFNLCAGICRKYSPISSRS